MQMEFNNNVPCAITLIHIHKRQEMDLQGKKEGTTMMEHCDRSWHIDGKHPR
jgi:hypothetical protein